MRELHIEEEIWKPIIGYEGLYEVSNFGNVKSLERYTKARNGLCKRKDKILKFGTSNRGYERVKLYKNKDKKDTISVHKLVALAFIENPHNFVEINHIDGNKSNNYYTNIEWCSRSHNVRETYRLGLKPTSTYKGEGCVTSKLKEKDVLEIRKLYKEGIPQTTLARQFSVVPGTINFIIKNQTWAHI